MEIDREYNISKQKEVDLSININILKEATRLYQEYLNSNIITIGNKSFRNYIPLVNPINVMGETYLIYDEETAFYSDKNPIKICLEEFKKLKEDGD